MKYKLLAAVIFFSMLQSCTKSDSEGNVGTIEFKLNGQPFTFKNTSDRVHVSNFYKVLPGQQFSNSIQYVVYGNDASNPSGEQNLLSFYFDTDTLKTDSYVLDFNSGGQKLNTVKIGALQYVTWPGDEIIFKVDAISENMLEGTFSGKMSPADGSSFGTILITEGKVRKLQKEK